MVFVRAFLSPVLFFRISFVKRPGKVGIVPFSSLLASQRVKFNKAGGRRDQKRKERGEKKGGREGREGTGQGRDAGRICD